MKYKVQIAKPAEFDIFEIHQYISDEYKNPEAADRRTELIYERMKSLDENPARFALVRDEYLASKGVRLMVVKTQNVFYIIRENPNIVFIIRVLHYRRDCVNILRTQIDSLLKEIGDELSDFTTE